MPVIGGRRIEVEVEPGGGFHHVDVAGRVIGGFMENSSGWSNEFSKKEALLQCIITN